MSVRGPGGGESGCALLAEACAVDLVNGIRHREEEVPDGGRILRAQCFRGRHHAAVHRPKSVPNLVIRPDRRGHHVAAAIGRVRCSCDVPALGQTVEHGRHRGRGHAEVVRKIAARHDAVLALRFEEESECLQISGTHPHRVARSATHGLFGGAIAQQFGDDLRGVRLSCRGTTGVIGTGQFAVHGYTVTRATARKKIDRFSAIARD